MAKRTVKVGSKVGLHARPASLVAEKAADYDDEILLFTADEEDGVDASSQMMVMTLGADYGTEVTVESDNAEAVEAIADLIEQDLDA